MHPRALSTPALAILAVAVLIGGCGGSNDNGGFERCGNGVVDAGEECDDGNLIDTDTCLSTCQRNVCGDGVLNQGVEQCDRHQFGGATCSSLGFERGDLSCTAQCTIDTSACSGTGTPATTTPVSTALETPSATSSLAATPAAVATPSGNACKAGDQVAVVASLTTPYAGVQLDLVYPASAVNVPGTGSATSVTDRVTFAAADALTAVSDHGTNGAAVDDTLTLSFASASDHGAGPFVTVTFDCIADQIPPTVASFTCTVVSASTTDAQAIPDEQCTVAIQ